MAVIVSRGLASGYEVIRRFTGVELSRVRVLQHRTTREKGA